MTPRGENVIISSGARRCGFSELPAATRRRGAPSAVAVLSPRAAEVPLVARCLRAALGTRADALFPIFTIFTEILKREKVLRFCDGCFLLLSNYCLY